MTPAAVDGVSRLMHTFSRNYVGPFNSRHGRTGTLWEGRYKACLVDSGRYFLACSQYIELNPVRAWMVAAPEDYPWSSHRANADGNPAGLLTPHPEYAALGSDAPSRAAAYQALFASVLSDTLLMEIRGHLQQQRRSVLIASKHGSNLEPVVLPACGAWGGQSPVRIVPGTFSFAFSFLVWASISRT